MSTSFCIGFSGLGSLDAGDKNFGESDGMWGSGYLPLSGLSRRRRAPTLKLAWSVDKMRGREVVSRD